MKLLSLKRRTFRYRRGRTVETNYGKVYGGKSTREEEVRGVISTVVWERELTARVKTVDRYDREIELCADCRPKDILRSEQVWQVLADIEKVTLQNATFISYAKEFGG